MLTHFELQTLEFNPSKYDEKAIVPRTKLKLGLFLWLFLELGVPGRIKTNVHMPRNL